MKKLQQVLRWQLVLGVMLAVAFPVGMGLFLFGLINDVWGLIPVGAVGLLAGFYGSPFIWLAYAGNVRLRTVLRLIETEELLTVNDLAAQTSQRPATVAKVVNALIVKGYLTGYRFRDGVLTPNTKRENVGGGAKIACRHCGATMTDVGTKYVCEYCGRELGK